MPMKTLIPKITITGGILLITGITLFQIYIAHSVTSSEHADLLRLGGLILVWVGIFRKGKFEIVLTRFGTVVAALCMLQFFRIVWEYYMSRYLWQNVREGYLDGAIPIRAEPFLILMGAGIFFGLISLLLKMPEDPIPQPAEKPAISPRIWLSAGGILLLASYTVYTLLARISTETLLSRSSFSLEGVIFLLGGLTLILVAILKEGKPGERFSMIGAFAAGWCGIQCIHLILQYTIRDSFSSASQSNYSLPVNLLVASCLILGGGGVFFGWTGSISKTPTPAVAGDFALRPRIRSPRFIVIAGGVLLIVGALLPWFRVLSVPTYSDSPFDPNLTTFIPTGLQGNGIYNGDTLLCGTILVLLGVFWEYKRRKLFATLGALVSILCGFVILWFCISYAFQAYSINQAGGDVLYGFGLTYVSSLGALLGLIGSLLKEPGSSASEAEDLPSGTANTSQRWMESINSKKWIITGGLFLLASLGLSWITRIGVHSFFQSITTSSDYYFFHPIGTTLAPAGGLLLILVASLTKGKPGESFSLFGVVVASLCTVFFFHLFRFYIDSFLRDLAEAVIKKHFLLAPLIVTLYFSLGWIGCYLSLIGSMAEVQTEAASAPALPISS